MVNNLIRGAMCAAASGRSKRQALSSLRLVQLRRASLLPRLRCGIALTPEPGGERGSLSVLRSQNPVFAGLAGEESRVIFQRRNMSSEYKAGVILPMGVIQDLYASFLDEHGLGSKE